ncbi:hypothetical protein C8J57DRAFT_1337415 [Mycena rebaudengoi]|nr:hypothetical protein C8J57DRAFT_1337415 [Mycena rebaudengoi]
MHRRREDPWSTDIHPQEQLPACSAFLGPLLNDRLAKEEELGRDWEGKPNDLVSWLLEKAEGSKRTAPAPAMRILATNMAAIHTSSTMALTQALYDLTTYPEHILPIQEEAERSPHILRHYVG